jgi:Peptidase family M23
VGHPLRWSSGSRCAVSGSRYGRLRTRLPATAPSCSASATPSTSSGPTTARACTSSRPAPCARSCWAGARATTTGGVSPVYAAFDGLVVAAVDGVPERARVQVVREVALALKNTVGFDPARSGFEPVAGNHVIVQGAEAFAVFAHLAPGTVSVITGQEVRVGEMLGRVGHTGNSTAPHLVLPAHGFGRPAAGQGHPVRLRGVAGAARWRVGAGRAWRPWPRRKDPLGARNAHCKR